MSCPIYKNYNNKLQLIPSESGFDYISVSSTISSDDNTCIILPTWLQSVSAIIDFGIIFLTILQVFRRSFQTSENTEQQTDKDGVTQKRIETPESPSARTSVASETNENEIPRQEQTTTEEKPKKKFFQRRKSSVSSPEKEKEKDELGSSSESVPVEQIPDMQNSSSKKPFSLLLARKEAKHMRFAHPRKAKELQKNISLEGNEIKFSCRSGF